MADSIFPGTVVVIRSVTVVMTDAQIKAIPTTPVALVPAPGDGKLLVFHYAVLMPSLVQVYGNVDVSPVSLFVVSDETWSTEFSTWGMSSNFLEDTDTYVTLLPRFTDSPEAGFYTSAPLAILPNQPFYLSCQNSGNFTGGDPANTMSVTVYYSVLDL